MKVVTPPKLESQVCRDPDDDNILAAALGGNCDCIITGDKDLLTLKSFAGITIVDPAEAVTLLGLT